MSAAGMSVTVSKKYGQDMSGEIAIPTASHMMIKAVPGGTRRANCLVDGGGPKVSHFGLLGDVAFMMVA